MHQPDGGYTRADRAYAAFLASAREAGVEIRERTPVRSLSLDRRSVRLTLEHGELTARAVVVAAGAWASTLLAPVGIELPVIFFPLPTGSGWSCYRRSTRRQKVQKQKRTLDAEERQRSAGEQEEAARLAELNARGTGPRAQPVRRPRRRLLEDREKELHAELADRLAECQAHKRNSKDAGAGERDRPSIRPTWCTSTARRPSWSSGRSSYRNGPWRSTAGFEQYQGEFSEPGRAGRQSDAWHARLGEDGERFARQKQEQETAGGELAQRDRRPRKPAGDAGRTHPAGADARGGPPRGPASRPSSGLGRTPPRPRSGSGSTRHAGSARSWKTSTVCTSGGGQRFEERSVTLEAAVAPGLGQAQDALTADRNDCGSTRTGCGRTRRRGGGGVESSEGAVVQIEESQQRLTADRQHRGNGAGPVRTGVDRLSGAVAPVRGAVAPAERRSRNRSTSASRRQRRWRTTKPEMERGARKPRRGLGQGQELARRTATWRSFQRGEARRSEETLAPPRRAAEGGRPGTRRGTEGPRGTAGRLGDGAGGGGRGGRAGAGRAGGPAGRGRRAAAAAARAGRAARPRSTRSARRGPNCASTWPSFIPTPARRDDSTPCAAQAGADEAVHRQELDLLHARDGPAWPWPRSASSSSIGRGRSPR